MEALIAADADAQEIEVAEPGQVAITAEATSFDIVQKALQAAKITILNSELAKIPDNRVDLTDPAHIQTFTTLVDALEEHDDVQEVWHNADLPDEP